MMHALSTGRMLQIAAVMAVFASPALAQTTSHVCFPNDAVVGGKHIQPTQAEVEARLDTPACRAVFGNNNQGVDESTAVQRELSGIDKEIQQQSKGLANSSTPGTN
jgi:hypothetical protein